MADSVALPPRASIALLTLQLRAALREADDAERAEAKWSAESPEEVRRRIDSVLAERRLALSDERAEAERRAAEMIARARAEVEPVVEAVVEAHELAAEVEPVDHEPHEPAERRPLPPPQPGSAVVPALPSGSVVIEPEVFARAVAAAVAAVLADRPVAGQPVMPQWVQAVSVQQPRKSFWSGFWHADVLLALMAMAIILVILLAWST